MSCPDQTYQLLLSRCHDPSAASSRRREDFGRDDRLVRNAVLPSLTVCDLSYSELP
jgi:hypothetical protein